jgi:signal transduction histidine kinase
MRLKILAIFIVSILTPTALLAYFGLRAVRGEKAIIEENIKERYEGMADIVESEIKTSLSNMPEELAGNTKYTESVMLGEAAIFRDQVKIFDRDERDISGSARSFTADVKKKEKEKPALMRPLKGLPYTIAVYERHPLLLLKLEQKKKGLSFYMALIVFSALVILCGGFFTLSALSREWHSAELKSEFVSHLSHDLRRPLTSIRMFSEMLKEGRLPNEKKKQHYYNIITDESERLTHLANNILDFSRIERGRKKYNIKSEDVTRVARDTVNHFKAHMEDGERRITLNIAEGIPEVRIDPDAISQALMNLLTNAVKFSPAEQEITVNLVRGKNEVTFEVIDRGIGISPSERKRIFDKFYRASKREIAQTDGSGLGLTLVKYIAQAHKGRVEVESEEGKGSKFSLVLPV